MDLQKTFASEKWHLIKFSFEWVDKDQISTVKRCRDVGVLS